MTGEGILYFDRALARGWVFGRRCHDGLVGCALLAASLVAPRPGRALLRGAGLALVRADWPDRPWTPERRVAPGAVDG